MASGYVVEHLNHLGIVAEVCREIGVADWLDAHDPGNRQQVNAGTVRSCPQLAISGECRWS
jgi:hypothetical protein